MHNLMPRIPHLFSIVVAGGAILGGMAVYRFLRPQPSPDEMERKRREMLMRQGRIIDGTILDICDVAPQECNRPVGMQLVLYKYEISGVVYECSQDVKLLAHVFEIDDCKPSFPVSVRYDPHNPGNSIIIGETWSGLRKTAQSVPVLRKSVSRPEPRLFSIPEKSGDLASIGEPAAQGL